MFGDGVYGSPDDFCGVSYLVAIIDLPVFRFVPPLDVLVNIMPPTGGCESVFVRVAGNLEFRDLLPRQSRHGDSGYWSDIELF